MYTTPLSTFISSLSLNHHHYADDSQLFSRSILVMTQFKYRPPPGCSGYATGCIRPYLESKTVSTRCLYCPF